MKINFRQPKYVLPLIVFLPLCGIIYFVSGIFSSEEENIVPTDQINANLPDPYLHDENDKMGAMQNRYGDDDENYTAVGALGQEVEEAEIIEHGYSEDELNRIDAEEAERIRQQKELEEMRKSLAESRKHINSYGNSGNSGNSVGQSSYQGSPDYSDQLQRWEDQNRLNQLLYGSRNQEDREELIAQRRRDSIAEIQKIERERNRPNLVLKSQETNADKFNTVTESSSGNNSPLIRAMIDKTTKAHEGTRLRFKLLDAVTIKGITLPKGTYLYGTVKGFGQQRVKASINSILIGNKFIKVDLSVFDNDGMEGFYVPESAFRDFMKEAGANVAQQSIQFDSGTSGYGSGISGEAIALQALQNIYNSASSAISANIRKNRAKIKYSSIIYLINSEESR